MDYDLLKKLLELLDLSTEKHYLALELILNAEKKTALALKEMMDELQEDANG